MKNLALLLNLNPEASEGAIKGELEKLVNAKKKAETDLLAVNANLVKIQGERDSYKEKLETIENKAVTDYVDEVIKLDPKKAENKDSLVNMAKVDFEMFKNMNPLKKVVNKGADIADGLEPEAEVAENGKKDAKEFHNLSYKGRIELKNSDSEKYQKLVAAYDKYAAEIL